MLTFLNQTQNNSLLWEYMTRILNVLPNERALIVEQFYNDTDRQQTNMMGPQKPQHKNVNMKTAIVKDTQTFDVNLNLKDNATFFTRDNSSIGVDCKFSENVYKIVQEMINESTGLKI